MEPQSDNVDRTQLRYRLAACFNTGLLILATSLWTLWSVGELYWEGWAGTWRDWLLYLSPALICLLFALTALRWPRVGGWLLVLVGSAFTAWRWSRQARAGTLTLRWALSWLPVSGCLVVAGVLFLLEACYRPTHRAAGPTPPTRWLQRHSRYILVFGCPLLIAAVLTAHWIPILLTRTDDGDYGVRFISGNDVALIWAPRGPGWNAVKPGGGYLSWDELALYGVPPVGFGARPGDGGRHATAHDMATTGLCRYLSADGLTLVTEPQDVWRLPTADEIVRSLVRHGENAGCTWDGRSGQAECGVPPDKETPLWDPDMFPPYYWSADEYDAESAWYVPYTGGSVWSGAIGSQPKSWGNVRHGYRCVREP